MKIRGADHQRHEAVHLQREHMIERQCGDEHLAFRADRRRDPRMNLAQIRDHVAMGQHRALRHAGGAAGVLKERDIVRLDRRVGERLLRSQRERAIEAHGLRQAEGGNGAPDVAHDRIDDEPFGAAQLVAGAGDDDDFDRRPVNRLFERAGEVLQNDDRLGARIGELMLELARRVQRVAVDDDVARAQRAEGGDRILQHVRHHQRDAGAARQARNILQIAREGARLQVQFAIGHRLAHADEGGPIAKLFDACLDEIAERAERARSISAGTPSG